MIFLASTDIIDLKPAYNKITVHFPSRTKPDDTIQSHVSRKNNTAPKNILPSFYY
jgi:hypothetical protein